MENVFSPFKLVSWKVCATCIAALLIESDGNWKVFRLPNLICLRFIFLFKRFSLSKMGALLMSKPNTMYIILIFIKHRFESSAIWFFAYNSTTSHIECSNFGDTLKGFGLARASAHLRWVMKNNKKRKWKLEEKRGISIYFQRACLFGYLFNFNFNSFRAFLP